MYLQFAEVRQAGALFMIPLFALCAGAGIVIVLLVQAYVAFLHFVVPSVVGPMLHSAAFVCVILGCQLTILGSRQRQRIAITIIAGILLGLAQWVASWDVFNTSLASITQRAIVAVASLFITLLISFYLATLPARMSMVTRVLTGCMLIVFGMIGPAIVEQRFLVDLL
jgi:hypothetical protein